MMEDWEILRSFFPCDWEEMAWQTDALKGLRKDTTPEAYLRALLLHVGCGYSLRETVTRAKRANLADMSDVALLGRLKKAQDWLHALCAALLREQVASPAHNAGFQVRLFDIHFHADLFLCSKSSLEKHDQVFHFLLLPSVLPCLLV